MKQDKKHFLGKNSFTRVTVDALLESPSAKNSKKALIWGGQLYYMHRQRFSDALLESPYLYIYWRLQIFGLNKDEINFRRGENEA